MSRPVSRREAARLRQRVERLEKILAGGIGWPDGVNVWSIQYEKNGAGYATFRTARRLGHALVATFTDDGLLTIFAVKP